MAHILFLFNIAKLQDYVKKDRSILLEFRISEAEKYQAKISPRCGHMNRC